MALRIGDPIPHYEMYLRRNGVHGAIIHWVADGNPVPNIDGTTMRIIVGDRAEPVRTYDAVTVGNTSTWHFTQEDTDLPFDLYDGLILLIDGANETPVVDLKVLVQPG